MKNICGSREFPVIRSFFTREDCREWDRMVGAPETAMYNLVRGDESVVDEVKLSRSGVCSNMGLILDRRGKRAFDIGIERRGNCEVDNREVAHGLLLVFLAAVIRYC